METNLHKSADLV